VAALAQVRGWIAGQDALQSAQGKGGE